MMGFWGDNAEVSEGVEASNDELFPGTVFSSVYFVVHIRHLIILKMRKSH